MTILIDTLKAHAASFDDRKYPTEVYLYLLDEVARASTPDRLGEVLAQLIAWKDGKVRSTSAGAFIESRTGRRYAVSRPRPKVLNPKKKEVLSSRPFFEWVKKTRTVSAFDIGLLDELATFELWRPASVVMSVFVLHCIRPRAFPICDVWVLLAYRLLVEPEKAGQIESVPKRQIYLEYQIWWSRVVLEAKLDVRSAPLEKLKELDSGIWAFGKHASKLLVVREPRRRSQRVVKNVADDERFEGVLGDNFKHRAVAIWNAGKPGKSQGAAIAEAALELGIELKRSYKLHPGSHFWRWRQEGIF
ncbi:hypothetical protein [Paraburkholderia aromaticivorans]|uniref:Uncharacterized protein n=1 Tax=Paraburkholderia aromaticivorans TaxID=2026199 RepID=A0A248VCY6_9BURK|nr:hypothetical protein [Paraburkholderia aromaticivorans]ASV96730.1 hypothetical protein CJU94_00160 [Paraburkholderia aromaticivorans]